MTGWDEPFSDPIALPDGDELHRLRDAGGYVVRLANTTYRTEPWRVAIHLLIQATECNIPVELARLAVVQALHPTKTAARILETA